ncbi:MAG: gamma-glutamyltransferase, partial [Stellaceae bacterium]
AMRNGSPLMAFGVMGGPMQAQGHVQLIVRTQLFQQNPQAASDAPRWRAIAGRQVALEAGTADTLVAALEARGHVVKREAPEESFAFGGAQLVCREGDVYVAGSDHRKDGAAVGF